MNPWMAIAYDEALKGMETTEGGPFGAVIVRNNEVIARAHNEVLISHDPTAHAEILAIRRASALLGKHDLSECILYTTCYPCPMCLGAILWARLSKVCYASTTQEAAAAGFEDTHFYEALKHPKTAINFEIIDPETGKKLLYLWHIKEDKEFY